MATRHDVAQRSPEWQELRRMKITGTTLKSILGTPAARTKAFYATVAELLTVPEIDAPEYENPMDRGTRLEPQAIAAYEFHTGSKVMHTGFVESDELPLVGQSPDGDVSMTDGGLLGIEVKCLLGEAHMTVVMTNTIPKDYIPQGLQYLITDPAREAVDFVFYNPEIPRFALHVIRMNRAKYQKEIMDATYAQEVFVKEVLDAVEKLIA